MLGIFISINDKRSYLNLLCFPEDKDDNFILINKLLDSKLKLVANILFTTIIKIWILLYVFMTTLSAPSGGTLRPKL